MKKPIKIFNLKENTLYIQIFTNDTCNYKCWYCYNHMPRTKKLIDFDVIHKFIFNIKKQTSKKIQLSLIGGEPSIHPNLYSFCKEMNNLDNIEILVSTNLSQSVEFYDKLMDIDVKMLITYHKNQEEFVEKLSRLKCPDMIESITVMFDPVMFDDCRKTYEMVRSLGFDTNKLNLSPVLDSDYEISDLYTEEQLEVIGNLDKDNCGKDFKIMFEDKTIEYVSYNDLMNYRLLNCRGWKCNVGMEYLDIDITGNVYNCKFHNPEPLCNLYETNGKFILPTKPVICKSQHCNICFFDINKERLFKC